MTVKEMGPLWQSPRGERRCATLAEIAHHTRDHALTTSFVAGLLWQELFSSYIPSYLSGIIGGVTAVPMWEFLKRIKIK